MINVGSIKNAGGAADYLTSTNSQLTNPDFQGAVWGGQLAASLGLQGEVDKATLVDLLNGKLPADAAEQSPLEGGEASTNRRLGTEFVISAPKSVSLLAVAYGDTRILEAVKDANTDALNYAEQEYAQTRIREDGEVRTEKTGNFITARVTHGYDDAGNVHLHDHVFIPNITRSADGQIRALDNSELWKNSALISAHRDQILVEKLRELGYNIHVHSNGKGWDIEMPREVIEAMSSRGADIKAELQKLGLDGYEANRIARYDTRENTGKTVDPSILDERARRIASSLGYNGYDTVNAAQKQVERGSGLISKAKETVTQAYKSIQSSFELKADIKLTESPYLPSNIKEITRNPDIARTYVVLANAIEHREQNEAAFKERDVLRDSLNMHVPGVTLQRLQQVMEAHKENGLIIPGQTTKTGEYTDYITTRDSLATERQINDVLISSQNTAKPWLERGDVSTALQPHLRDDPHKEGAKLQPNDGQLDAAKLLLSENDGVVVLQGYSGTGKTSTLAPVSSYLASQNVKTYGLSNGSDAVEQLRQTGIESNTIASFLSEHHGVLTGDGEAVTSGKEKYQGSLVVIDEASQVGNRDFLRTLQVLRALDVNVIALIGDKRQLQAVAAGKAFEVVQHLKVAYAELTDVVRQRVDNLKSFSENIRVGKVAEAFKDIRTNIVSLGKGPAYLDASIGEYLSRSPEYQAKSLLITMGNADRITANSAVQSGLVEQGRLGPGQNHTIYENRSLTDAELRRSHMYEQGNILRVANNRTGTGLRFGDYTVEKVEKNLITVTAKEGNQIRFDPRTYQGDAISRPDLEMKKAGAMALMTKREIQLHEGDKIRWSAPDKSTGIATGNIDTVQQISDSGITFNTSKGEIFYPNEAVQTHNLDLAYAVNSHKVQGASTFSAIVAAAANSKFLTTIRAFYVNNTRSTHELTVFTNNVEKLQSMVAAQDQDKMSALEIRGELDPSAAERERARQQGDDNHKTDDLSKTAANDDDKDLAGTDQKNAREEASAQTDLSQKRSNDNQDSSILSTQMRGTLLGLADIVKGDDGMSIRLSDIPDKSAPEQSPDKLEPEKPGTEKAEPKPEIILEKKRDFDIS